MSLIAASQAETASLMLLIKVKRSEEYSDFTIFCGDRKWKVHRVIICNRSGYFKKVCNGSFKEAKELEITLLEDDPEIVNQMVDYLYCSSYEFVEKDKKQKGHPDLDAIPHAKVYAIAEKYQISSLKYLAKEKAKAGFQKLWDGDQFSALIDFVWNTTPETDDHEGLRSEITDFIVAQKSQIYKKGALLESLKDKGELAVKILSGVSCEIERYEIGYSKLW